MKTRDSKSWVEEQSGAVEACWAHNPEVRGSKPRSANLTVVFCGAAAVVTHSGAAAGARTACSVRPRQEGRKGTHSRERSGPFIFDNYKS